MLDSFTRAREKYSQLPGIGLCPVTDLGHVNCYFLSATEEHFVLMQYLDMSSLCCKQIFLGYMQHS
jgi:hypothetical protein